MALKAWSYLLTLSVLWGGSFFFVEIALRDVGPFAVVTARVALAAAALWLWGLAVGHRVPGDLRLWRDFAIMGALNNALPFTLIAWGQLHIASGLAAIFNATTPLFVVLVAHIATDDEKLNAGKVAGVLIGLAGVTVLVGPWRLAAADATLLAQLAVLAGAVSYAFAGVFGRRLRRLPPTVAATGMLTASSAIMVPLTFLAEGAPAMPGATALAALAALALLSTALAYNLYFRILALAGATNLLLVTFLIPISALLLGVLLLDETVSVTELAGMAIIFVGLACVDGRAVSVARSRMAAREPR